MEQKKRAFSKRLIKQVIAELEAGVSRYELCEKYGMCYSTLGTWVTRFGSPEFLENQRIKITKHQKRLIVLGIQEGRMTIKEAMLAYKVKGARTIRKWLQESTLLIKPDAELDSKKPMNHVPHSPGTEDLEQALRQANLKILALETLIDTAEEQLKIKIRKKPGAKQ